MRFLFFCATFLIGRDTNIPKTLILLSTLVQSLDLFIYILPLNEMHNKAYFNLFCLASWPNIYECVNGLLGTGQLAALNGEDHVSGSFFDHL